MRYLGILLFIVILSFHQPACKSKSEPVFCDTACNNDTLRFSKTHPLMPYVTISMKNCRPDTITWSHDRLETNRKMSFMELVEKDVKLNKDYVSAVFNDTSYVWLQFNDCVTGRGFLLKLPFDRAGKMSNYTSALTGFDPKYRIGEGLISYFDNMFIYVQDIMTGKVEKMKLHDEKLEIDFDKVHKTFDSVHITRNRIYVNLYIHKKLTPVEKNINL